jgi:hypothetical protein
VRSTAALAPALVLALRLAPALAPALALTLTLGTAPLVAHAAPHLTVSPSSLDFGSQFTGDQAILPVVITNTGDADLTITSVFPPAMVANAAFPSLRTPLTLTPGELRGAAVYFSTYSTGPLLAYAYFTSDDPATPVYQLPCTITGVQPQLTVTPQRFDFGVVIVPATVVGPTIVVSNPTILPITILGAHITSDPDAGFTVDPLQTTLDPGASASVRAWFTAGSAGVKSGSVSFLTMPHLMSPTVSLNANAIASRLAAAPTAFSFAPVLVGERSAPQTITIANQWTAPIQVAAIDVDDPDFTVDAAPPIALAPSEVATFTVAYTPRAPGHATAHIAVTLAGDAAPAQVIAADGEGVAPAAPAPSIFSSGSCAYAPGARAIACSPRSLVAPLALAWLAALAGAARRRATQRSDRTRKLLARR